MILKFPGVIHSRDLSQAWGSGDTHAGGLQGIKGQRKVCALRLAAVGQIGQNCGRSKVAAVGPAQQHREPNKFLNLLFRKFFGIQK